MIRKSIRILAVSLWLVPGACATTTYAGRPSDDSRLGNAVQQPLRDMSWMREDPPEILKQAALDPYRLAEGASCVDLFSEIGVLDLLLGPDVDAYDVSQKSGVNAGGRVVDAVAGYIALPFRGAFRWLSGADQRDKVLADAILSGVVRRAFLKGVAYRAGCAPVNNAPPEPR
jgi:hypothetical protein